MDGKALKLKVGEAVEDAIDAVGVALNSASAELLAKVPGLSALQVRNIRAARPFASRAALKRVKGVGPKAFENAAGFLRVLPAGGTSPAEPLDATSVHPESYALAKRALVAAGAHLELGRGGADFEWRPADAKERLRALRPADVTAVTGAGKRGGVEQPEVGADALRGVLELLCRPLDSERAVEARRAATADAEAAAAPPAQRRRKGLAVGDLEPGVTVLEGIVRNVVDFGAFVDVGVKTDGLLHRSEVRGPDGRKGGVRDLFEALRVGQRLTVRVKTVDVARGRIALEMAPG